MSRPDSISPELRAAVGRRMQRWQKTVPSKSRGLPSRQVLARLIYDKTGKLFTAPSIGNMLNGEKGFGDDTVEVLEKFFEESREAWLAPDGERIVELEGRYQVVSDTLAEAEAAGMDAGLLRATRNRQIAFKGAGPTAEDIWAAIAAAQSGIAEAKRKLKAIVGEREPDAEAGDRKPQLPRTKATK